MGGTYLADVETWELEQELERRKKQQEELPTPIPRANVDIDALYNACQQYIRSVAEDDYSVQRIREQNIFTLAVETVYGKGQLWEWVRKQRGG